MSKRRRSNEHKLSTELREACEDAYNEQHSHNPKAGLAFLALGRVVPKLANALPGWSSGALTRSFFGKHRKGLH